MWDKILNTFIQTGPQWYLWYLMLFCNSRAIGDFVEKEMAANSMAVGNYWLRDQRRDVARAVRYHSGNL